MNTIPLGKQTQYAANYAPDLLYPIPRKMARSQIGLGKKLPFYGYDIWNAYDLSWLNSKGKPEVGIGEFIIPCDSENLIESKSFKLYLDSFNGTKFSSIAEVQNTLANDLSNNIKAEVMVNIKSINNYAEGLRNFSGINLDEYDIACNEYQINPDFLFTENADAGETLYSHILKSNCPVTGQPDFGSVSISYQGEKINHQGLLKYIVSFRDHNEFHEACAERIFMDILNKCAPKKLTVFARYSRRGGLDINPLRTNNKDFCLNNQRLYRQ